MCRRGAVVIAAAKLHSTEFQICDGENLYCPSWKQGLTPFVGQSLRENNRSSSATFKAKLLIQFFPLLAILIFVEYVYLKLQWFKFQKLHRFENF